MTPERFRRLRAVLSRRQTTLSVLMENVHKPHNYAAVLRTCDAVGVHRAHAIASSLVVSDRAGVSASAADWVDVHIHANTDEACRALRQQGFRLYAAHVGPQARDFREVDYTAPTCIVLGAEKLGISATALSLVDGCITIPMQGMVDSLNVSVAAAVILFEAQRQRTRAGAYEQQSLDAETFNQQLFEWSHPRIASHCRRKGVAYPEMDDDGQIVGDFPR